VTSLANDKSPVERLLNHAAYGSLRYHLRGLVFLTLLTLLITAIASIEAWTVRSYFLGQLDVALLAAATSIAQTFASYLTVYLPLLPFIIVALNVAPRAPVPRFLWLAGAAVVFGVITASQLGLTQGVLPALLIAVSQYHRRAHSSEAALARERIETVTIEAESVRARLHLLRAQIEPHFLFNTLSNVRQLARMDAPAAVRMLDMLMRYLATAIPRVRMELSTLAEEAALAGAYLSIQQIRMGSRLHYAIDIPSELGAIRIPSMMLLTLIENSIKHGLNPVPAGGKIEVSARTGKSSVELHVRDDGQGITATSGSGTGLSNISSRLRLQYGPAAALTLRPLPRGLLAIITIPSRATP
jgi:signal transduction histidine kinase